MEGPKLGECFKNKLNTKPKIPAVTYSEGCLFTASAWNGSSGQAAKQRIEKKHGKQLVVSFLLSLNQHRQVR